MTLRAFLLLGGLAAVAAPAPAQVEIDLETGIARGDYNNVRIPGAGGTGFSFTRDLADQTSGVTRVQLGVTLGGRHLLRATAAPLRLRATGAFAGPVLFNGATFAAGAPVTGRWRFDTYRLTYRYRLVQTDRVQLAVGATALVRDAEIALTSGASRSSRTDTGVVPLLSVGFRWRLAPPVALVVDADGLAAPQGRAFDGLAAVEVEVVRGLALRAGYRAVEGGVDNDDVYNFSLTHQLVGGLGVRF